MESKSNKYPRINIEYYQPETPKGYWIGSIEFEGYSMSGTKWRGESEEDVRKIVEGALPKILEEEQKRERDWQEREDLYNKRSKTLWGRIVNWFKYQIL